MSYRALLLVNHIHNFIATEYNNVLPCTSEAQHTVGNVIFKWLKEYKFIPEETTFDSFDKYGTISISKQKHKTTGIISVMVKKENSDDVLINVSLDVKMSGELEKCTTSFADDKVVKEEPKVEEVKEEPVVTKNEDKENDIVQEIHEDPEESTSVETEVDTTLSDEQETSEERHSENVVNIQYPHEVIVAIGEFVNSVNLFNIGNMVLGEIITVAQTNIISEQIFEIMGHSDIIRKHIPELICDIGSSMDYRKGVFSIDVHVVLDITIQKLTSDYVMSFKVVRK